MALRTKQLSNRRAASKSPQTSASTTHDHCIRGWWRDTLFNTSKDLNAQFFSFSSHLESLRNAQKHMHLLARKCTQARLYPNPASANSKPLLKAQLGTLEADMDFSTKLHDMYSAALNMYTFPVQAVIDSLNTSGKECHCSDCTRRYERWKTDTHTEIRMEAEGLMRRLLDINKTFRKLHKELLQKWEKTGRDGLRRMINALPEQEDLKSKAVVRKYFPRQVREIEEAELRTIRKPTAVGRSDSKIQE
ncbi:hypothetical protein N0V86_005268 [Didymella sp. IMI 355093]|nr:hypothetical protein N0V86_005268 [Didymella sp. IMI 355093]